MNFIYHRKHYLTTIMVSMNFILQFNKFFFITFVTHFINNFDYHSKKYFKNSTIKTYLRILNIDPNKLIDDTLNDFFIESKNLVKSFLQYPTITKEIYKYIITRVSKLDF